MYLSRFRVQNYKCLADVDIPLTPFHVIIGENDSGKTSLLEAIGKLYREAGNDGLTGRSDSHHYIKPKAGVSDPNAGDSHPSIDVLHGADHRFTHATWSERRNPKNRVEVIVREAFASRGAQEDSHEATVNCSCGGEYSSDETQDLAGLLRKAQKEPEPFGSVFRTVYALLGNVPIYSFDPQTLRVPCAFDTKRRFRIDADGFGLATFLDDILSRNPKQFIRISEDFCTRFPQFESVSLETADGQVRVDQGGQMIGSFPGGFGPGRAIFFDTSKGLRIPASQVSDGVMLFLGLLALAHVPDPPRLLLMEEPENGVYPKRLREMIQLMRSLVEREGNDGPAFPQIILTTHSPYVLTDFTPEEVTLLSRYPDDPGKGVRARPLSKAKNLESYGKEFYLGELWYNLDEEELFGEP